jgi:hypothetical protein
MPNFIKIRPVFFEFLHVVGWAEGDTDRNDTADECMFEVFYVNS